MSQSDDLIDIKVAIGVLKEQNTNILKRQESMEKKIDGFTFAKQSDLDEFRKEVKETYATKDEVSPLKKVFYAVIGAFGIGAVGLIFWLAQRGFA